jgi:hypothetical protein
MEAIAFVKDGGSIAFVISLAMVDCGGRFCYNRHGQFVKDGGAIAFYGSLKWWIFRFPLSTINNKI